MGKKVFKDHTFPPNENSLIKGYFQNSNNNKKESSKSTKDTVISKKWSRVKWIRASEFCTDPAVFNKEIDPNDIKQGALNNCYFLSVLAALSEYPERVKSLFLTDKINQHGIYGIKLCKDGEWIEVVIDDYFPCDSKKSISCFSSGSENSLWVQIIEKCYAKIYGSYHKIEGGIPEHALRDLTGAPSIILDNSNDNLLSSLKEACEKRWIITASAGETEASKDLLKEVGLIPMHCFTILEVQEFTIENDLLNSHHNNLTNNNHGNNTEFLLKIRNPWGKNEWIGDWNDFNNIWKENYKLSNSKGCFFMNFKDFKHYFSKIQICKVHDDYKYQSIKLSQNVNSYCLVKMKINNDHPSSTFLSLVHPDKKKFLSNNSPNDYKYSISRFIVAKINTSDSLNLGFANNSHSYFKNRSFELNEVEYIGGKMGQDREIFEERVFESGEYLLFTEIDWGVEFKGKNANSDTINKNRCNNFDFETKPYHFVLSTYSANDIELSQVKIEDHPDILQKIYRSCAKKHNNVVKFTNEGAPNCYKYTNVTPEGYAYIYFENNEEDATLIEDVKYTKFEGLKLLPPFSGTSYYVKISPGQSQIVLIKQVDMTGFNLIYSYHSNFEFGQKKLLELTMQRGKKSFRKDTKLNIVSKKKN